jgi:peptidoglycan/LPS O-acetylase OafA/YrhL
MRTIGQALRDQNGVGPGFDALRIVLAFSVLFVHCNLWRPAGPDLDLLPLVDGLPIPTWAFTTAIVPLFFALSGFLVAGSAESLSLRDFITNRALRIVPALAVEIILCSLILGPLVTDVSLATYLQDPQFHRYFLNMFGWIQYELPGVFKTNPQSDYVNGSLWTVPHEISVYIVLAVSIYCGVFQRRTLLLCGVVLLFVTAIAVHAAKAAGLSFPGLDFLSTVFVTRGAARLVPVFFVGVLLYRYRDRIPFNGAIAAIAATLYVAATCLFTRETLLAPIGVMLTAPLYGYIIAWIGLSPRFALRGKSIGVIPIGLLAAGDYSYGIYLYGYPMQQTLIHVFPGVWNTAGLFLASGTVVMAFAIFSWHTIERPVLRLRRRRASSGKSTPLPDYAANAPLAPSATSWDRQDLPGTAGLVRPAASTEPSMNQNTAAVLME